jgi:hypothetical protein
VRRRLRERNSRWNVVPAAAAPDAAGGFTWLRASWERKRGGENDERYVVGLWVAKMICRLRHPCFPLRPLFFSGWTGQPTHGFSASRA